MRCLKSISVQKENFLSSYFILSVGNSVNCTCAVFTDVQKFRFSLKQPKCFETSVLKEIDGVERCYVHKGSARILFQLVLCALKSVYGHLWQEHQNCGRIQQAGCFWASRAKPIRTRTRRNDFVFFPSVTSLCVSSI